MINVVSKYYSNLFEIKNVEISYYILLPDGLQSNEIAWSRPESWGRPKTLDQMLSRYKSKYLKPGLANWSKGNKNFRDLTESLDINKFNNKQIFKQLLNSEENEKQTVRVAQQDTLMIDDNPDSDRNQESIDNAQLSKIVFYRVIKNWSVESIGAKLGATKENINEAFKLIKKIIYLQKKLKYRKEGYCKKKIATKSLE